MLVLGVLGLSKDAIHVYLGLAVFFLTVVVLKKGKIDLWAMAPVIILALSMETIDLYDSYRFMDSMYWSNSIHDIINTTFWPFVIVALAKSNYLNTST